MIPSDDEILLKLTSGEDSFVERKSIGDWKKDALKTAVAFANSAPVGYPAILFIGVKNDGTIEGTANLDTLQQTVTEVLSNGYPTIYHWTKIIQRGGKECLAVIVPGSANKPHFAGHSYVRKGSESVKASESQFTELVTSRGDKAPWILKWKDMMVTVHRLNVPMYGQNRIQTTLDWFVYDCNSFYVTLAESQLPGTSLHSFPLRIVDVSFDNARGRLALEIRPA